MKLSFRTIALSIIAISTLSLNVSAAGKHKFGNTTFKEVYRDGTVKEVQKMAQTEHKPLMIIISDKNCNSCKKLDSTMHWTEAGTEISSNFIIKKMEASNLANMMQASQWGITSVPAVVFMNSKGEIVSKAEGVINPEQIMQQSNNAFDKMKDQNNRYCY